MPREIDRLGQRGATGGGQDTVRRDAGRQQRVESGPAFADGERLALAGRSEWRDAVDASRKQTLRMSGEPRGIERALPVKRTQRRAPQALEQGMGIHGFSGYCALRFGRDAGNMIVRMEF